MVMGRGLFFEGTSENVIPTSIHEVNNRDETVSLRD